MSKKKIVIVGGVAGGASCASRCRRLDETAEILVLDRGPYVSFANCGLPYYVGDVIKDESKLLLANAALFRDRFNIEVRTEHEVVAIDRAAREIEVKEVATTMRWSSRRVPRRCVLLCRGLICRGFSWCARSRIVAVSARGSAKSPRRAR